MRRIAVAVASAFGWPALACAQHAPLDNAVQSLSDVAFAGGHARAAETARPAFAPPLPFPVMPDMAAAVARPLQASGDQGLHLGGEVPARTVGAFIQGKLRDLGVVDGSARYGGEGRFYLFAAVHGQAVGLNLQTEGGGLHRTGWSTDQTSALVGDGQVGFGWRKGGMEAAIGYVHRGVHLKNVPIGARDSWADDMGAVSFTLHPDWGR